MPAEISGRDILVDVTVWAQGNLWARWSTLDLNIGHK